MRLEFHGAAGTVTGSKYRLETGRGAVLVDAGLFQGKKALRLRNWESPGFEPGAIDAVLLTHVHVDHVGYLPRLVRLGYRGPVFATAATVDLAAIVLRDAAKIQEEDAAYANRKGFSKHSPALPLFDAADAEAALRLLRPVPFGEWMDTADGIRARWTNTGHLLGAAMIEVEAKGARDETRLLFSGDVGRYGQPLHVDPSPRPPSDWLVIESTYGNRTHPGEPIEDQLLEPMRRTLSRRGVVLVPAFAVGRSQLVTLVLRRLMGRGTLPEVPIHIDSPMAVDATSIYSKYLDARNVDADVFADGRAVLFPDCVEMHRTVDESKHLNALDGPRVIISSSGMMVGGRILHHLRQRLPDPRNLVCLAGFQAEGTRGRALVDGAKTLRMHGEDVPVRAEVVNLSGFSGHADAGELMRWYRTEATAPRGVFVTHGEPEAAAALAKRLEAAGAGAVRVPDLGEGVRLSAVRT
ncbi:MAG: MBL fold metallo-hydrolase RNA specificity domain-containing protein [Candidatus Eiseniibacteriota bacterium]